MVLADETYMRLALELARQAAEEGEVPVGAVIVRDGEVIATGRNRRETARHALAHAEIEAIAGACARLGGWRLSGCDLYVTLEPCPMCAGAIINARLSRVVQGTADPKAGSCGSVVDLFALPYNHRPVLVTGVLEEECAAELTGFFQRLRRERDGKICGILNLSTEYVPERLSCAQTGPGETAGVFAVRLFFCLAGADRGNRIHAKSIHRL